MKTFNDLKVGDSIYTSRELISGSMLYSKHIITKIKNYKDCGYIAFWYDDKLRLFVGVEAADNSFYKEEGFNGIIADIELIKERLIDLKRFLNENF